MSVTLPDNMHQRANEASSNFSGNGSRCKIEKTLSGLEFSKRSAIFNSGIITEDLCLHAAKKK